ncbi:hypothetical protein [Paraburkholderia tuberum]|uniref:Uncharacterized protein n=1 Tax=Paraburkholderia tuberum TaxID=157910 RepID=A0A1H1GWJ8_9BURK|nr:hypothetical protein [Paraburkholderia tuberum]SDR17547.1 hypothetical protein SAMN05445850_3126 [Paraburkholderia tuberum]
MPKLAYDMSPADQRAAINFHRTNWRIDFPGAERFFRPEWRENYELAMDAAPEAVQQSLVTTENAGIPAFLSFFMDPDILRVLTAPNEAAEIFGEKQKGEWTSTSLIFPVVERTYEVSTYGDYNNNGRAGINTNFPERQPYLYQTICEYGDLEIDRVGLAKIGFVAEQKEAAIDGLNKFQNLTYFRGVAGLQNYGALNDPAMWPAIAPAPKAAGGTQWLNGTSFNATPNEIYNDIAALAIQIINQSAGRVNTKSRFVLGMSPSREGALTATNGFNVNVAALLEKNFPRMEIRSAVQYGARTAQNPQGSVAGEIMQMFCPDATGQDSGFCSFPMKLRAGQVVRALSSWAQKMSQGSSGFILRQPFAMGTMVGL